MTILPFRTEREVAAAIPRVVRHLETGGLIAYPTDTVYGLGSRPHVDDLDRLAALKGRPPGKPFLLLVNGLEMLDRYRLVLPPVARRLAAQHWPGPLTLVLSGGEGTLPAALRGPEGGIAVRWTSHPGALRLIGALGVPITSTSANRPGDATAPGVGALARQFREAVDDGTLLVLDGGVLGNVPPSTLVSCVSDPPRILREGAIPRRELRDVGVR